MGFFITIGQHLSGYSSGSVVMGKNRSSTRSGNGLKIEVKYIKVLFSTTSHIICLRKSNMAHFGMLPEHKQMLKKNRLCLLEGMNPEPVLQRLYQQNMMSQIVLESIQALPTRYGKNAALVTYLPKHGPKVFKLFCRALSASGQIP